MSTPKQTHVDLFDLPSTVRKLRGIFQETQPQFAARLEIAVVTLARWETTRPPRGEWLDKLAELADSRALSDYAETFRSAKGKVNRGPGRPRQEVQEKAPDYRNEEERRYALALLRVLRNPEHYEKSFKAVEKALMPVLKDMNEKLRASQARADVEQAIRRLHDEGRSLDEIAEIFNLKPENIKDFLDFYGMEKKISSALNGFQPEGEEEGGPK